MKFKGVRSAGVHNKNNVRCSAKGGGGAEGLHLVDAFPERNRGGGGGESYVGAMAIGYFTNIPVMLACLQNKICVTFGLELRRARKAFHPP